MLRYSPPGPPHPYVSSLARTRTGGFSLVEVALALSIVAVALVSLIALMPSGAHSFRRALNTTICTQIAERIISDARNSDFSQLINETDLLSKSVLPMASDRPYTFRLDTKYFDDQGREIIIETGSEPTPAQKARVTYQANTRIMLSPILPQKKVMTGSTVRSPGIAQMTIQIVEIPDMRVIPLHPGNPDDPAEPNRNLWKVPAGAETFTTSAMISRTSSSPIIVQAKP